LLMLAGTLALGWIGAWIGKRFWSLGSLKVDCVGTENP
jgi:hypothetical protein